MKKPQLMVITLSVLATITIFSFLFSGAQRLVLQGAKESRSAPPVESFSPLPAVENLLPHYFLATGITIQNLSVFEIPPSWIGSEEAAEIALFYITALTGQLINSGEVQLFVVVSEGMRPWWDIVVSLPVDDSPFVEFTQDYVLSIDAINGELRLFSYNGYYSQLPIVEAIEETGPWPLEREALDELAASLAYRYFGTLDQLEITLSPTWTTYLGLSGRLLDRVVRYRVAGPFGIDVVFSFSYGKMELIDLRPASWFFWYEP